MIVVTLCPDAFSNSGTSSRYAPSTACVERTLISAAWAAVDNSTAQSAAPTTRVLMMSSHVLHALVQCLLCNCMVAATDSAGRNSTSGAPASLIDDAAMPHATSGHAAVRGDRRRCSLRPHSSTNTE